MSDDHGRDSGLDHDAVPLRDEAIDDDLRTALLLIDCSPALGVDVDEVIRLGSRRRRALTVERVLAVAAAAVVVAGVGVFAVGRSTAPDLVPLGPSASPRPTAPAVVAPDVMSGWWYTLGDPAKHVGLVVAALKNESTEPVTVSGLTVSGAGGIRAVLTPMVSAVPKDTTISIGYLRKLDLPSPASVLLPPGRSMFVVISVPATCTTADDEVSASITVSLRSASGGTKDLVLPADAGPPTGWVRSGRAAACPQPSTG